MLLNTEVHQVASSSWNDLKKSKRVTGYTPLDRLHVTSYWCAKVLHIPYCFQDTIDWSRKFSHPKMYFTPPMRESHWSCWNFCTMSGVAKPE